MTGHRPLLNRRKEDAVDTFRSWFAESPLASWARAFAAIVITLAVAEWVAKGSISVDSWETWVIAALSATVPTILRWLNPADPEFGRYEFTFTPDDDEE